MISSHAHPGRSCRRSTALKGEEKRDEKRPERREVIRRLGEARGKKVAGKRKGEAIGQGARAERLGKGDIHTHRGDRARRGKHG